MTRLLILGGTTEASALARQIAKRDDIRPVLSLAGRTRNPATPPIPYRIGGFGGVGGLTAYLADGKFDVAVDATHPFAAQMSRHAEIACRACAIPLAAFTRPPWREEAGDRWIRVATMEEAVRTLGATPRRVFVTVGGLQLAAFTAAPQHHYVVRAIERPEIIAALPSHRLTLARGPFGLDDEIALMRDARIEFLVTKNSGGVATAAKVAAARMLGITVIMVDRPPAPDIPTFHDAADILGWIEDHRPPP